MNIIFHRGHVGFQEANFLLGGYANHAPFDIDNYIEDRLLMVPITEHELDLQELGDAGVISNSYLISSSITVQYLYWDVRGASVVTYHKSKDEARKVAPVYTREVIGSAFIQSSVLGRNAVTLEYLNGLVYADATFAQINQFCQELRIGGGTPFIWFSHDELCARIEQSRNKKNLHRYRILRDGTEPSEHLPRPASAVLMPEYTKSKSSRTPDKRR